jgi:hydrogenase expression/formation protein HypE
VVLGHGSGGKLSDELLRSTFLPVFENEVLGRLEDQATLELGPAGRIAFTTDSFVVRPLFFPGGDIGSLAVHGTVNDLAVGGAEPRFLAAAFILEEGFPLRELGRVVQSMRGACAQAGVRIVTGDTKVVERGKADGMYVTTTGIGVVPERRRVPSVGGARPGDRVIVSGTVGDHGIALMADREGIELETALESDSAPLHDLVRVMYEAAPEGIRSLRDATRGGVSSALNEIARASGVGMVLREQALPMRAEVKGACELLGLDPLHVANEGKLVAVVAPERAEAVLAAMRAHELGRDAAVLGEVVSDRAGGVRMRSGLGADRVVDMLAGEQLPRIC